MDQPAPAERDGLPQLIASARDGCGRSLELLLQACRGYMLTIANDDLDTVLMPKLGASDIVQESMLEVQRDIGGFRGSTEAELLGWLRRIVKHNVHDVRRQFLQASKRSVGREEAFGQDDPTHQNHPAHQETPSRYLSDKDEATKLLTAMKRLSDEHRRVIELRNWELRSFAEIGRELDRSEDAARKLWARAVTSLKKEMLRHDEPR